LKTQETERRLYQFPLSLYCEKTRWNLDWKKLEYRTVDMMPGAHVLTAWRLAGQRTLPILQDGRVCSGDSTRIALYLEQHYPEHPLLPADAAARQAILALEDFFDELGEHVRRCVWSLAVDSPAVSEIFFREYAGLMRWSGKLGQSLLRQMIRRTFDVYPADVEASWSRVFDSIAKIGKILDDNPAGYLVGNRFSLADLTAASMLAPLAGPEESPWADRHVPVTANERRRELRATSTGQWVQEIYRRHRHA
jgi:glutathione S-transferase